MSEKSLKPNLAVKFDKLTKPTIQSVPKQSDFLVGSMDVGRFLQSCREYINNLREFIRDYEFSVDNFEFSVDNFL